MKSASAVASTEQAMSFPQGLIIVTAIAVASAALAEPVPVDIRYQQWQRLSPFDRSRQRNCRCMGRDAKQIRRQAAGRFRRV